jgi:hypothetical protein
MVEGPLRRRWKGPVLLASGAIAAVGLTHLIDFGVYDLRYTVFNANSDASWSHVVDAGALAVAAVICLVGAWRVPRQRRTWLAIAVLLIAFFADELTGLHTQIGTPRFGKLLYAPVLAVLVYCVWRLMRGGPYLAVARASAALLLASYVVHVLDPHNIARGLGWRVGGWAFQVVVVLKEGMELAGVLLAVLALWGSAEGPSAPQVRAREGR